MFQLFFKFKAVRTLIVFALVMMALDGLNNFVVSTFANFVMPNEMVKLWNFFDMNTCVSIVIAAFEGRLITNLILKFGAAYLSD
ncbi:MAG: hypothetical protein JHC31_07975 [Sulfurihydrogenibium sp.]|nr:hypothetical protein [Sulfurihydrogenibium sp.]